MQPREPPDPSGQAVPACGSSWYSGSGQGCFASCLGGCHDFLASSRLRSGFCRISLAEQRRRESEAAAEQERANQIARAKASGLYVIEYSVEGSTSSASLTFTNQSGGTEQHKVDLPWRQSMTVKKGFFAYISAQNQKSYGALTVKILLNGIPVKSSDSSGEYGIASASGKV